MKRYKVYINAASTKERDAIQRAMNEPDIRATLLIVGLLAPLTPRGRERVMRYVVDELDDPDRRAAAEAKEAGR